MVCKACRKVLLRRSKLLSKWKTGAFYVHHKDVESLRKAAEDEQCVLCYRLWCTISEQVGLVSAISSPTDCVTRAYVAYHSVSSSRLTSGICNVFRAKPAYEVGFELCGRLSELDSPSLGQSVRTGTLPRKEMAPIETDDSAVLREYPRVFKALDGESTAFSHTLPVVQQWLQKCCDNHTTCNNDFNRMNWNPSRLLDLQHLQNGKLCLVNQTSFERPVPYITLSHRWGQADFIKLTRSTEDYLMMGVRLSELPLTFQHACQVTRGLGHRYLWIDSLCIKQDLDDLSDWISESSLMHKVYRHGELNISATSAKDGHDGLFRHRNLAAAGFGEVKVRKLGLLGTVQPYSAIQSRFWEDNVQATPLNRRAWVLQERILSKRVLHFGQTQLLWECRELNASESFPDGLPDNISSLNVKSFAPSASEAEWLRTHMSKYEAHEQWRPIVYEYSACSLTRASDKLVAIMGVAKQLSMIVHDTYVAGMWRRYLVSELAWIVINDEGQTSRRLEIYIAPTWSWASLEASVAPGHPSEDNWRVSIKDVILELATEDSFGPLRGGKLILEGILRRAKIHRRNSDSSLRDLWTLHLPDQAAIFNNGDCISDVLVDVEPDDNFEPENTNGLLFCIEIQDLYGLRLDLLLLRCEDNVAGVFSRVGLCWMRKHERSSLLQDEQRFPQLPCISYDADKELHTICVV